MVRGSTEKDQKGDFLDLQWAGFRVDEEMIDNHNGNDYSRFIPMKVNNY